MAKTVRVRINQDTKVGGDLVAVTKFNAKGEKIGVDPVEMDIEAEEAGELLATGVAELVVEEAAPKKPAAAQ